VVAYASFRERMARSRGREASSLPGESAACDRLMMPRDAARAECNRNQRRVLYQSCEKKR